MSDLPYTNIPDYPEEMNASNIMLRLVDGIGFRYRWATEGLEEENMQFQACDTSMDMTELLKHVNGLLNISESYITGKEMIPVKEVGLEERRKETLETVLRIRDALSDMDDHFLDKRMYKPPWRDTTYPIWTLINGPLSDSLTHIGQIASWRRIHGNPIPGANVFDGVPPKP